jgi:hypothetical protein
MRHLVDAEQVVGIEVIIDEAAVFELQATRPGMGRSPSSSILAMSR